MLNTLRRTQQNMKTNYVGLLDADFIKYLVIYDIEKMYKQGLDPALSIPDKTIKDLVEKRIEVIRKSTIDRTKDYIFLFSGKTRDNHRAALATTRKYKGTRKYNEKFPHEGEYRNAVEEYIKDTYHYHKEDDKEADDLCVMAHTEDTYIYSHDKDLRASPGVHFDIKSNKFVYVSYEEGFKMLLTQAIKGDSVDNIIGIKGIGKVGAEKITKDLSGEELVCATIKAFLNDKNVSNHKEGLDRFVEMYSLVNMVPGNGEWVREKYKEFFDKVQALIDKEDDNDNLLL